MNSIKEIKVQKYISKRLLIYILVMLSTSAFAQDLELLRLGSAYYPSQSIENSSLEGEIGFFEVGGKFTIPQLLKKDKSTILLHTLGYNNLRIDTKGTIGGSLIESNKTYHTISYTLGLVQKISNNWRWMLNLNPTIATDFEEDLSQDDFLYQANTMFINGKNSRLKYGFGVAFTNRFGRSLIIPTALLKYKTAKMNLDIILPNKITVILHANKFHYGFAATLNGGLFNNTSEVASINDAIDEAGYSRVNLGPMLGYSISKSVLLNVAGGITTGRRLEFIDINESTIDRTPQTGPYFRVAFLIRPKSKD